MEQARRGEPWTEREVRVALGAYFRMLMWQTEGRSFVKADVREEIAAELPARSKKSVELKWCNISAVLDEMDLPWVAGYKPMSNFQRSLRGAVAHWLDEHPEVARRLQT